MLFLAVFDFTPGGLADDPTLAERREQAAEDIVRTGLAESTAALERHDGAANAAECLRNLGRRLRQQAWFVVKGLPIADRLDELSDRADAWSAALPGGRDEVLDALGAKRERWPERPGRRTLA